MKEVKSKAARVIRRHIEERGIKISFISERANIDSELLGRALRGVRTLKADELIAIVGVLGMDFDDFRAGA